MNSVNSEEMIVKPSNLYKKLGIVNNMALKPPKVPKEQNPTKGPRRQTMLNPQIPEVFKQIQRYNTFKAEKRRCSSNFAKEDLGQINTVPRSRNLTPKSRFISDWISKNSGKENSQELI